MPHCERRRIQPPSHTPTPNTLSFPPIPSPPPPHSFPSLLPVHTLTPNAPSLHQPSHPSSSLQFTHTHTHQTHPPFPQPLTPSSSLPPFPPSPVHKHTPQTHPPFPPTFPHSSSSLPSFLPSLPPQFTHTLHRDALIKRKRVCTELTTTKSHKSLETEVDFKPIRNSGPAVMGRSSRSLEAPGRPLLRPPPPIPEIKRALPQAAPRILELPLPPPPPGRTPLASRLPKWLPCLTGEPRAKSHVSQGNHGPTSHTTGQGLTGEPRPASPSHRGTQASFPSHRGTLGHVRGTSLTGNPSFPSHRGTQASVTGGTPASPSHRGTPQGNPRPASPSHRGTLGQLPRLTGVGHSQEPQASFPVSQRNPRPASPSHRGTPGLLPRLTGEPQASFPVSQRNPGQLPRLTEEPQGLLPRLTGGTQASFPVSQRNQAKLPRLTQGKLQARQAIPASRGLRRDTTQPANRLFSDGGTLMFPKIYSGRLELPLERARAKEL
ncbi:hypothetical protein C7M84_023809 [Penaeus vannamei]|uniref:Uncharacterized protein n=1 Tax=Penaeus vannamei TaxID=6689 RepID=A0A3R7QY99_PENVA|nr:hypothetical protein C7M84_023809 [Penaeus vannamei]